MIAKITILILIFSINIISLKANTLDKELTNAYINSDYIKIQEYSFEIDSLEQKQIYSNFLPSISLDASYGMGSGNIIVPASNQFIGFFNGRSFNDMMLGYGVTGMQQISLYKIIPGLLYAKHLLNSKKINNDMYIQNFGINIINMYLNVIFFEKSLQFYKKRLSFLENKRQSLEIKQKYGIMNKSHLGIIDLSIAEIKKRTIELESNILKIKSEYKIATGNEAINFEMPKIKTLPFDNIDDFLSKVKNLNLQIVYNNSLLKQNEYQYKSLFMNNFPDIYVVGSYLTRFINGTSVANSDFHFNYAFIGINASWTFNTPENKILNTSKSFRNKKITEIKNNIEYNKIIQDAEVSWYSYYKILDLIKTLENAIISAKENLSKSEIAVSYNLKSFIDNMEIENQAIESEIALLESKRNLIILYYKILSLSGIIKFF